MAAHPGLAAFGVAMIARSVSIVLLETFPALTPQLDDVQFAELASGAAEGRDGWRETHFDQLQRNATFLLPLSAVYRVFGPMSPAGAVFVAILGALTAAFVALLAREFVEPIWALAAGLVIALLPSQVYFSSLTLKDAMVWAVVSLVALAVARTTRDGVPQLAGWLIVVGLAILLLSYLRPHTLLLAAAAALVALWAGRGHYRLWRGAAGTVLAVSIPWLGGLGPAGAGFLTDVDPVSEYRQLQATGNTPLVRPTSTTSTRPAAASTATTAATAPPTTTTEATASPTTAPATTAPATTAPATTAPRTETTAPEWYDAGSEGGEGFAADLRHLPRGLAVMLVEPHPLRPAHNAELAMAKAEMVLWYPLLALALAGFWAAWKSRAAAARVFVFPAVFAGATILVAALAEGNFGTAYRHRGEFVWVVALFAILGARHLWLLRQHPARADRKKTPAE